MSSTGSEPTAPQARPQSGRSPSPVADRLTLPAEALTRLTELEERYQEAVTFGFLGPREHDRLRERHLDDALGLAVLRAPRPGERWADLGSGAGLPGLPLAVAFPATGFTLIDAQRRRLRWVEQTAAAMGLRNVQVVHERLEAYGQGPERASFDVAVARALAPPAVVLELGLPVIRVNGLLMLPRGHLSKGERALLDGVARRLGGGRPRVTHNVAGSVDHSGAVIMITKAAATPSRFPRRPGIPQRQPLT